MSIYIHFIISSGRTAEKLHNVSSIHDSGQDAIEVRMTFSDDRKRYTNVSHVAVTPERE